MSNDNKWTTAVALFSIVFVAFRALHQSMSIDEAGAWLTFSGNEFPDYFNAANQNHVLFGILSHITAGALGTSEFSVRLPNIFAAAIYTVVGVLLGFEFFPISQFSRVIFLACLTLNPFVLDYLVAARGYGLALAFLMLAIYLFIRIRNAREIIPNIATVTYASTFIGFSIAANFSFGFVDAVTLGVFVLPFFFSMKTTKEKVRLVIATVVPPCIVLLVICGSALQHYTSKELVFGASNLVGTFGSLIDNSFDGPSNMVTNELLFPLVKLLRPIGVAGMIAVLIWGYFNQIRLRDFSNNSISLAVIFLATTAIHETLNLLTGLPLPVDRTALYFAPLIVLMIASLVARSTMQSFRVLSTAVLTITAIFFIGSLRENYFNKWRFDEHVKEAYDIVLSHIPPGQSSTLVADWKYVTVVNFYSSLQHYTIFPKLEQADTAVDGMVPTGRAWYILCPFNQDDFIKAHNMKEIFRIRGTEAGDIVVATPK